MSLNAKYGTRFKTIIKTLYWAKKFKYASYKPFSLIENSSEWILTILPLKAIKIIEVKVISPKLMSVVHPKKVVSCVISMCRVLHQWFISFI